MEEARGISRRISQSGKSAHQPPPSFLSLPEGFITLAVAQKSVQRKKLKTFLTLKTDYDIILELSRTTPRLTADLESWSDKIAKIIKNQLDKANET
jgi:hypothetical protein